MRIQEISTDSRIGEFDLLLGSMFIGKDKYRNKNYSIRDIINHVRAGVSVEGGRLSVQYAWQDERSPYTKVEDLINKFDGLIIVPANGLLLVKMVKNENGAACDDLYLFTRTDCEIGEGKSLVYEHDFIKIKTETLNRGLEETSSFVLNRGHHKGLIYVVSDDVCFVTVPEDLQEDFEVSVIRLGMGEVKFVCTDRTQQGFVNGNKIESHGKVDLIRRPKTKIYNLFGNTTF
jgi:hypothetical protein